MGMQVQRQHPTQADWKATHKRHLKEFGGEVVEVKVVQPYITILTTRDEAASNEGMCEV
jgi:hypothetical protein